MHLEPPLTLGRYRRVLLSFYTFYAAVEPQLECWALPGLDWSARRKVPLLRQDLFALAVPESHLPMPTDFPAPDWIDGWERALGCLYVLEGATLGGQQIVPHIKRQLPVTEERGCAFFYSYGPRVRTMWDQTTALLNTHLRTRPQVGAALRAARRTFEIIERLSRPRRKEATP